MISASAPGRVNLIGDHTDYTGGLVLPMVLDCRTTIEGEFTELEWDLTSADEPERCRFTPGVDDPRSLSPRWGRYVACVVDELRNVGIGPSGFRGHVSTTIPIGSGLSSSAALEVAVARLFADHTNGVLSEAEIAQLCRRAEHAASGVPCGIMDQLCIVSGRVGHATLIDCRSLDVQHIRFPDDLVVSVEFIAPRTLAGSEYADRVEQTSRIESIIGPLRDAREVDLVRIDDPLLVRRARHVISENRRVTEFVEALASSDHTALGSLMVQSHRSLAQDFDTSTPIMEAAVERLLAEPDVLGARMTGGGFGGCVIALRRR
jgi:galactokinase